MKAGILPFRRNNIAAFNFHLKKTFESFVWELFFCDHVFQSKKTLKDGIDKFIEEKILLAAKAISEDACLKICDGDVILVYSRLLLYFTVCQCLTSYLFCVTPGLGRFSKLRHLPVCVIVS